MKVKIGDKVYDSFECPVMIILSKDDKDNISNMHPEATKYCSFPDDKRYDDVKIIEDFMKINLN